MKICFFCFLLYRIIVFKIFRFQIMEIIKKTSMIVEETPFDILPLLRDTNKINYNSINIIKTIFSRNKKFKKNKKFIILNFFGFLHPWMLYGSETWT